MKSIFALASVAALLVSTSVMAQTTPPPATPDVVAPRAIELAPPPAEVTPAPSTTAGAPVLTDDQAKALKDKVVYSSDNKNVGEVAGIKRDADGRVTELHADVGGFLGFGETRVRVMPGEFTVLADRVVLTKTAEQVNALPQVVN